MDGVLESAGVWLARAHAAYGLGFLLLPMAAFAYVPVLLATVWVAREHAHGRRPWPWVPARVRPWVRLVVEVTFGLANPVVYLAILAPALPGLQPGPAAPLTALAWILLVAVWAVRVFGAALDPASRAVHTWVRLLLWSALACVLGYLVKDAWLLLAMDWPRRLAVDIALNVLRASPLYLVPAVLLWDYARAGRVPQGVSEEVWRAFFVLPHRAARAAFAGFAMLAALTVALTAHRRSEGSVRELVTEHRAAIRAAALRYDVDPRLIAAIVYVTHRDQLSPFRDALERVVVSAWAGNLRREFGILPPDRVPVTGTDENPLLNRALDISVGLAQIKPRTAQTASVLATGLTPRELPAPAAYGYRDVEPLGSAWDLPPGTQRILPSPIPVPAARAEVTAALLDSRSNLATAALIIALYQHQWEAANPAWSLRARPEILSTLYQIGFARSKPHAAPRANAFGRRVRDVRAQPWLNDLFPPPVSQQSTMR